MTNGYCMKCKKKTEMTNVKIEDIKTTRGIKRFAKGNCPLCNTKISAVQKME